MTFEFTATFPDWKPGTAYIYADVATGIEEAVWNQAGVHCPRLSNYDLTDNIVKLLRARGVRPRTVDPESGGACIYVDGVDAEALEAAFNDYAAAVYELAIQPPAIYPDPTTID